MVIPTRTLNPKSEFKPTPRDRTGKKHKTMEIREQSNDINDINDINDWGRHISLSCWKKSYYTQFDTIFWIVKKQWS